MTPERRADILDYIAAQDGPIDPNKLAAHLDCSLAWARQGVRLLVIRRDLICDNWTGHMVNYKSLRVRENAPERGGE